MNASRREFLRYFAMTAAVAAASGTGLCGLAQAADDNTPDKWVKGVCRYCGTGCGVLIGVKNGKAVAIQGDPILHFLQRLAFASQVDFAAEPPADVSGQVTVVTRSATAYLPLAELVDISAELERIAKEKEKAENGLRIVEQKLSNEKFVSRAPEAVVNAEKEKAAKFKELIAKLEESAKALGK